MGAELLEPLSGAQSRSHLEEPCQDEPSHIAMHRQRREGAQERLLESVESHQETGRAHGDIQVRRIDVHLRGLQGRGPSVHLSWTSYSAAQLPPKRHPCRDNDRNQ